ncbi:hypothetical protein BJ170DRAFT_690509 [Xylariales sp. AK1849]|nr:hypothetical protein BJ170DRAFT_690509 [Xylariales sp. AK1849]
MTSSIPPDPAYVAESNTTRIIAVVTVFHVLALVSIGLRMYARIYVIRAPGWDDAVMGLCALCTIGGWSVFIIQASHGLGRHQDTISPADLKIFNQAGFWQSVISAAWALTFLKISIALNLLRLGSSSKWYKWSLWGTILLNVSNCLSGTFTFFFFCRPLAGFWDKSLNPTCAPIAVLITGGLVNTAINIFTDVLSSTLPIPIIWNLKLHHRTKIYVIGILSLGYAAVAFGVVKGVQQIAFGAKTDKTFEQSVQFWGFMQLQVGIIAACCPTLKPLFRRILMLSSGDKYNQYNYHGRSRQQNQSGLATIGGANKQRSRLGKNEYELEERGVAGDQSEGSLRNTTGESTSIATSTFYKQDGESGSEERILPHATGLGFSRGSFKGIMKTTEVTVK